MKYVIFIFLLIITYIIAWWRGYFKGVDETRQLMIEKVDKLLEEKAEKK